MPPFTGMTTKSNIFRVCNETGMSTLRRYQECVGLLPNEMNIIPIKMKSHKQPPIKLKASIDCWIDKL